MNPPGIQSGASGTHYFIISIFGILLTNRTVGYSISMYEYYQVPAQIV